MSVPHYLSLCNLKIRRSQKMINSVIDISHHQGANIDFAQVKAAGIVGVIHKAPAGTGFKDNMYPVNRQKAVAAG